MNYAKKLKMVKAIEAFMIKYDAQGDSRIYFSGKAWCYSTCHDSKRKLIENIKAEDMFDYADNKSICMTFEGGMYDIMNMYYGCTLYDKFLELLQGFNCYCELGNAWNLTIMEDE